MGGEVGRVPGMGNTGEVVWFVGVILFWSEVIGRIGEGVFRGVGHAFWATDGHR